MMKPQLFLQGMRQACRRCCWMLFAALPIVLSAQTPTILTQPILGAQTATSAKVWTMVKDCKQVELHVGDRVYAHALTDKTAWNGYFPVTFEVTTLPPDGALDAQLYLDGQPAGEVFQVRPAASAFKDQWSFLMGSCALYGLGVTGAVKPGRHTEIFDEMRANESDFMLWLGDNVYLLTGESRDQDRMYEKYTKVRLEPHTNAFLLSRPQYAILDDHDYGPDDAEGDFENKGQTVACFKDFWPNPYFGEGEGTGTYYDFQYQDASFIMLDGRWYRDSKNNAQVIGAKQMQWLKQKLKASTSTFKFVALGSQVLSEANPQETWSDFPERQELFDFIKAERISGVIFLTGDRHFTELCRLDQPDMYPLYDFTSSPMTSILRRQVNRKGDPEYSNALRVDGTKVVAHNFGKVTIEGPLGARICRLETYDDYGKLLWRHDIPQQLLMWDDPSPEDEEGATH